MKENQTRSNCIYAQLNIGELVQMKKIGKEDHLFEYECRKNSR